MSDVWQFIVDVPWWVYVLLIALLKIGIDAIKTQIYSFKQLFVMPIIL